MIDRSQGLSLYSSAGSSGGLFTSAAGLLPKVSSTHGFAANSQGDAVLKTMAERRKTKEYNVLVRSLLCGTMLHYRLSPHTSHRVI